MGINVERLKEQLKRYEGFSSKPYIDSVGKLTIGYGRNIEDNGITIEEAEFLLDNDIRRCLKEAYIVFPEFISYPPGKQEVIINMLYNLGLKKFSGFKKMIKAIKERNWKEAAKEMINSKWCKQVVNRCHELSEKMENNITKEKVK